MWFSWTVNMSPSFLGLDKADRKEGGRAFPTHTSLPPPLIPACMPLHARLPTPPTFSTNMPHLPPHLPFAHSWAPVATYKRAYYPTSSTCAHLGTWTCLLWHPHTFGLHTWQDWTLAVIRAWPAMPTPAAQPPTSPSPRAPPPGTPGAAETHQKNTSCSVLSHATLYLPFS